MPFITRRRHDAEMAKVRAERDEWKRLSTLKYRQEWDDVNQRLIAMRQRATQAEFEHAQACLEIARLRKLLPKRDAKGHFVSRKIATQEAGSVQ